MKDHLLVTWIKAHSKIEGNELANYYSKLASEQSESQIEFICKNKPVDTYLWDKNVNNHTV